MFFLSPTCHSYLCQVQCFVWAGRGAINLEKEAIGSGKDMSLECIMSGHWWGEAEELGRCLVAVEHIDATWGKSTVVFLLKLTTFTFSTASRSEESFKRVPKAVEVKTNDNLMMLLSSPRFCLYSDFSPICKSWFSKMTPLFLQTNLEFTSTQFKT